MSSGLIFLVVDSDADDLATFASALTSRYASEFDIRTAATASEAHATLAALYVAGITVALLIVSRDLGDSDLLLLLQRARELFPSARRVLSARYLDPSAFNFITAAMADRTDRLLPLQALRTCGHTALRLTQELSDWNTVYVKPCAAYTLRALVVSPIRVSPMRGRISHWLASNA
jgi:hypothetical protein